MSYDVAHRGAGRRVLLLHSGFHTWVEFRALIELLETDHEVLAPTLPGSAGGPPLDVRGGMLDQHAAYVEELLDAEGWTENVTAVGSSFGGVQALELLGRGRVSRAVALAPPWTSGAGLAFYASLFSSVLPAVRLSRPVWPWSTRSATITTLWFHQSRRPVHVDAPDVAALLDSVARFPFFRVGLNARGHGPGMPDFARIDSSRATLAWGDRDWIVPAWMRSRWSAALPEAEVVRLSGCAHQPHLTDPAAIAALVRAAVRR